MKNKILAVIKRPGEGAYVDQIDNDLKVFQDLVGGYIEVLRITEDILAVINEEGRIIGLPFNHDVAGYDLHGTIVLVATNGEEFASIPAAKVPMALALLR